MSGMLWRSNSKMTCLPLIRCLYLLAHILFILVGYWCLASSEWRSWASVHETKRPFGR